MPRHSGRVVDDRGMHGFTCVIRVGRSLFLTPDPILAIGVFHAQRASAFPSQCAIALIEIGKKGDLNWIRMP